jgi:cyclophilin family peptidyl-prolyl cis-trans isomerase
MEYKAEFNKSKHYRRASSMARSQDQDSVGSEFFIALKDSKLLDEQYSVWKTNVWNDAVDKIASLRTDYYDAPSNIEEAMKVTTAIVLIHDLFVSTLLSDDTTNL